MTRFSGPRSVDGHSYARERGPHGHELRRIGESACARLLTPYQHKRVFRIYVGGALLGDIQNYSRCVAMLNLLGPKEAADDFSIMAGDATTDFPSTGALTLSMPVISGLR